MRCLRPALEMSFPNHGRSAVCACWDQDAFLALFLLSTPADALPGHLDVDVRRRSGTMADLFSELDGVDAARGADGLCG
ncbi:hypothetical protein F5880DRAFT_71995, partial [Lentinula raphanica]